jgi:Amt family ammonium transporter
MSLIILKLIDLTIGLRVSPEEERLGLDIAMHGESLE